MRRLAPGWHVEAEQKQQGVEVRMEWIRRDADARALVLASENDEWGYDRQQVGVDDVEMPVDVAAIKGI